MANKIADFITNFGPLAQDISERSGIKPEVVLGQLANETGYGASYKNNNPFNITDGRGHFLTFNSIPEAAQAYVNLMATDRYKDVKNKSGLEGQADYISMKGYGGTPEYGRRVIDTAAQLMKAGYNPSRTQSVDPQFDQKSNDIFKKITGQDFPDSKEPTSNNVSVSSNSDADRADEIFTKITGKGLSDVLEGNDKTTDEPATESKTQPSSLSGINWGGDAAPGSKSVPVFNGTPISKVYQYGPGDPNATNALQSGQAQPQSGGIVNDIGAAGSNLGAGIVRGVVDVGEGLGNLMAKGANYMNQKFPALQGLDDKYGTGPNQGQMAARQAAEEQQYQQQYGDSGAAQIGRIGGNMIGAYPVTGPIGAAAKGIAGAGTALNIPLVSPLIRGAAALGSGAAQGAAGAGLTGGDMQEGALAGAAVPLVGNALSGTAKAVGGAANLGGSFLTSPIGKMAGRVLSYHFGDIPGLILGGSVGDALGYITKKFGAPAAQKAASILQGATGAATSSGVPFVAGEAAGQAGNPLQTQQEPQ